MRPAMWFGGGVALAAAAYSPFMRHRYLTWGATAEEVDAELPGDDLLPEADMLSTRAITIAASQLAVMRLPW